jgi:hypothetical protein
VTRTATGAVVANRYNFDLPDTGMIFPGDLLHYYFAATDHVAGDRRTRPPGDISRFGNPDPMTYPSVFSVSGLPSIYNAGGTSRRLLFWNDFGFRGGEDEWYGALRTWASSRASTMTCSTRTARAPAWATASAAAPACRRSPATRTCSTRPATSRSPTLSNGDFAGDPGNDLGLLNAWLALGGRDLFMTGDDLAQQPVHDRYRGPRLP